MHLRVFYECFFRISNAIRLSSSFFCSIFCLSCKIESSWIITFVCPTVIDFRIIIHTSLHIYLCVWCCPSFPFCKYIDLFFRHGRNMNHDFIYSGKLWLAFYSGRDGMKNMPSLLYIIFCLKGFCSRQEALGSSPGSSKPSS